MKRTRSLRLERLEDRTNPSTLTVSFVPDGTQVGAVHSELSHDFAGTAPAVWQQQLVSQLQMAISVATQNSVTLSIVPDDGAALATAAPQDGAIRIAAVNQLFTSDGTPVNSGPNSDFMVAGGAVNTFGIGLGLVGPNGQPLSPTPTPPGTQTSGSMLPLILPVQKAYGNLYPNPPAPTTNPAPPLVPMPNGAPTGSTTPSYSDPSAVTLPSPDATMTTVPTTIDPLFVGPTSP